MAIRVKRWSNTTWASPCTVELGAVGADSPVVVGDLGHRAFRIKRGSNAEKDPKPLSATQYSIWAMPIRARPCRIESVICLSALFQVFGDVLVPLCESFWGEPVVVHGVQSGFGVCFTEPGFERGEGS